MPKTRSVLLTAAAFAGLPLAQAGAQAELQASQCRPVTQEAGFDLLIGVKGLEGRFRLTCENGRLLAVPLSTGAPGNDTAASTGDAASGGADVTEAIDNSAMEAAEELEAEAELDEVPAELAETRTSAPAENETSDDEVAEDIDDSAEAAAAELDAEELDEPPAQLGAGAPSTDATADAAPPDAADAGAATETGENAAGVRGQTPERSVTEAPMDTPGAGSPRSAAMARPDDAQADADKPGVSEDAAAPEGRTAAEGGSKSENRIAGNEAKTEMVPVPVVVVANARLALPGVEFTSVAVDGEDDSRIYRLTGQTGAGRDVSVGVDPAGTILRVDREVASDEVPSGIDRIAAALLPRARLDRVMLSNRDNYQTFFVFSGLDERGQAFELEVRSDGRRVQFLRDS